MRGIAAGDSVSAMLTLSDTVTEPSRMLLASKLPRSLASLADRDDGGAREDAAAATTQSLT